MYLGRVVESAASDEIFRAPNHPYTQALLKQVPRLDSRKTQFKPIVGEIPSPLSPPSGCHFHPRCPFAIARCKETAPPLKEVGSGHLSACHLNDR
jgi:oligopeptide/dipeptide ABC transporter ATP-binding protein